ncbi:hypothetical protein Cpir12675_000581 [Ceratocystis pirilliformis]|uniref:Uncharacterized protein n=1 Tax=Ceratocystis pirilliformis TaxID=259994 RepID=A0ABR3ZMD6_9PEZI
MTEFLDVISFYPEMKMASIYIANNEEEPDHEDKLSLTEIYIILAGMKNLEPNDMKAVIFDVDEDEKTINIIDNIRRDRNLGPRETVSILPGDKEWDTICGTQYYLKLLQVMSKPVQKILLMNQEHVTSWGETGITYRIVFSSPKSQPREENLVSKVWGAIIKAVSITAESTADVDKKQEAALKALLVEEEWKQFAFSSTIGIELANRALAAIKHCDTSQLWT